MLKKILINKKEKIPATIEISSHLFRKLEHAIPHEAIKLYQNWFIPCITAAHEDICRKQSKEVYEELAEKLVEHLIGYLNKLPNALYQELECRNKDNAFVAIVFFAALIQFIIKFSPKNNTSYPVSPYRYAYSFLQLNRANEFLYRESYRLFELGHLAIDNPSIVLNFDIKEQLLPILRKPAIRNDSSTNTIQRDFSRWLSEKLKSNDSRYQLNEGGLVYCSPLKFGMNNVFITDELLEEYQKTKQISPETVLASIESNTSHYCFAKDKKVQVYKINHTEWQQTVTTSINIVEGSL